jgi:hypothetical protein
MVEEKLGVCSRALSVNRTLARGRHYQGCLGTREGGLVLRPVSSPTSLPTTAATRNNTRMPFRRAL